MKPNFKLMWSSYPTAQFPCNETIRGGGLAWQNQCAIRLSIALEKAGLSLKTYNEHTCKHGHARGAEPLANHLHYAIFWPKKLLSPATAEKQLNGKQGIVFFKDLKGFRGGRGDHIDLWNGSISKTGVYFGICKQVWFWELP